MKKGFHPFAKVGYQKRKALFSFMFVLPWLIGFLLFTAKPLVDVFIYSFNRVGFLPDASIRLENIGFENYNTILFVKTEFFEQIGGYLYQMALMVPVIVIFALMIALLLNSSVPGRRVYRVIFFLPVVLMQGPLMEIVNSLDAMSISGVDSMFVFSFIQNQLPDYISGPIMYVIKNFVTIVWYSGVQILLCLAGLQKLDRNMYEAASIDGASAWQMFWKVTLPVSRPFILLSAVYTVVDISTLDTNVIIQMIKNNMFNQGSGFGYPSAIAVMYFLIMLTIAGIVFLVLHKREKREKRRNKA